MLIYNELPFILVTGRTLLPSGKARVANFGSAYVRCLTEGLRKAKCGRRTKSS